MEMRNSSECLILGAVTWRPYMLATGDPAKPVVTGKMLEVLDIFAQRLGFCYTFIMPEDLKGGAQLENGSWTGQVKLALDREIEFTGVGLAMNYHRSKVVDFSEYVYVDSWSASYTRPEFQSDIAGFMKPYTPTVWILAFLSMLIVWICSFLVRKVHRKALYHVSHGVRTGSLDRSEADEEDSNTPCDSSLYDASIWTIATLLSQAIPRTPRGESVRLISGIWLLISLILATVYRSNLKAMLILPKISLPFDNLKQLGDTGIPVYASPGSAVQYAFENSPSNTTFGRIKKQLVGSRGPVNPAWVHQGILKGDFAFIAPVSVIVQIIHNFFLRTGKCQDYMMKEDFFKTTLNCLLLPKNSPWKAKLDPLIVRLRESGILDHIYTKGAHDVSGCLKPLDSQVNSNLRPMDLGDFYGPFLVYAGGILAVFMSFLVEFMMGRKNDIISAQLLTLPP